MLTLQIGPELLVLLLFVVLPLAAVGAVIYGVYWLLTD